MADDLSKRGPQDATRINVNEAHEVRYWTQTGGRRGEGRAHLPRQALSLVGSFLHPAGEPGTILVAPSRFRKYP